MKTTKLIALAALLAFLAVEALPAATEMTHRTGSVAAKSETMGPVTVQVRIRTGKTTELHLEREKDWRQSRSTRRSLISFACPMDKSSVTALVRAIC